MAAEDPTTIDLARAMDSGLAHDLALPHRDVLLAPDTLAPEIGAATGRTVTAAALLRVKYRLGESLRVLARVVVDGREHLVAGRMSSPGKRIRAAAPTGSGCSDALPPTAVSERLDTVWWAFPHDRRLRGVAALLDPSAELAADCGLDGRWVSAQPVQWTPERSLTLRALGADGDTVAFVKAYTPGNVDVRALAARYGLLAARLDGTDETGRLRSPRAIAALPARDLLVLEVVPGGSWLGLPPAQAAASLGLLGAAVAVLHSVTPQSAEAAGTALAHFGRLDPARLLRAGELIATVRPDLARGATALANALVDSEPAPEEHVFLHGDCHPGNLLVGEGSASLIDLDQSGLGVAALDLGSLLSRLQAGQLAGERTEAATDDLSAAFLAGYAGIRRLPGADTLRWHTAAALLAEQGVRAVSRVRRPELGRLDRLLALAETVRIQGVLP